MEKKWYRSKELWAAITGIVGAVGSIATGEAELGAGISVIALALVGVLRLRFTKTKLTK